VPDTVTVIVEYPANTRTTPSTVFTEQELPWQSKLKLITLLKTSEEVETPAPVLAVTVALDAAMINTPMELRDYQYML
jgi:hypothetical protein